MSEDGSLPSAVPHQNPNPMNPNALKNKSRFNLEKTATGKANIGFRKTDGVIMPREEYYAELKKNGYSIEFTPNGVLITPPNK